MADPSPNPFSPPAADLSGAPSEAEAAPAPPASPTQRLLACVLGLALGFAFMTASSIAGEIIATTVGIAATLEAWEPMDYAPGAVFLAVYGPLALRRLARSGQTLPLRMLGLRFAAADGSQPPVWRVLLLHGLPTALLFWGPVLAAGALRLGGPLDGALRVGGLVLLCINALSSRRASGRTWLDDGTDLRVVKA